MNFLATIKNEFFNQNIFKKEIEKPQISDYSNLYIYFFVPLHLEKVFLFVFLLKFSLIFFQKKVFWNIFLIILDCIFTTFILIPLRLVLGVCSLFIYRY